MKEGAAEYLKRLRKYASVSFYLQEEIVPSNSSEEARLKALDEEAVKALKQIKERDFLILFDLHGSEMDSLSFASLLKEKIDRGASSLVFLVGSSSGLSDILRKRADLSISLGKMTTVHPLALILGLEQVYRAFKINAGETYHK